MLKLLVAVMTMIFSISTKAQVNHNSEIYKALKKNDSLIFDSAFNHCKSSDLIPIIADDLEFYHDQGGITKGKDTFLNTIKQNICSNPKSKPIRKLVEGTLEVFPLYNNGVLYGALQKGDHNFYLNETGNIRPTVVAKFTHLWVLENKKWKLKRVLSYDHQPIKN